MTLAQRDLAHIWHPCSQMKDYETFPPLHLIDAEGIYLHLSNGERLIDAISSWWCKHLGHKHPHLGAALKQQIDCFEHVILANTTHETIVKLGEQLATLNPELDKALFASDGSCAIEIAMKMSLHSHALQGQAQRTRFMALENAYHGETCTTLAVSDCDLYRRPYQALLPEVKFLRGIPYVAGKHDPLWHDCSDLWPALQAQLDPLAHNLTAILIEPVLQGAGGMLVYSPDFLKRLRAWTKAHDIHLIADEIMTGLGRTGQILACDHAGITPDFLCLAKGLTAGYLPMSVCLTSTATYELFYDDYETGNAFMHSHTHSGNALAASVAVAALEILQKPDFMCSLTAKQNHLLQSMLDIAQITGCLHNVRAVGMMVAADLKAKDPKQRLGFAVFQTATQLGALLRPLGNTLYWLPPLTINIDEIDELKSITQQALMQHRDNFIQ